MEFEEKFSLWLVFWAIWLKGLAFSYLRVVDSLCFEAFFGEFGGL